LKQAEQRKIQKATEKKAEEKIKVKKATFIDNMKVPEKLNIPELNDG
jgi:hypothetical protein